MDRSNWPHKELSFLVLGKKMYSAVFGNWVNPERVIFMFSGNLRGWLINKNNDLSEISSLDQTIAFKIIQLCSQNDAYIFFNRFGYEYSDPIDDLFFIEDIPIFNNEVRSILIQAIEQPPKEIINFGHSCGGMFLLTDIILGNENSIDPINTKTDSNLLILNERKNYHWIILDPFLTNKIFVENVIKNIAIAYNLNIFIKNIVNTFSIVSFNFFSSLCIINKNKKKFRFLMSLFAEYCKQLLKHGAHILAVATNNYQIFFLKNFKMNPNLVELMDSFSLYRQKNCSKLLIENKEKFKLHVVGILTSPIAKRRIPPGFATNPVSENQMKNISNNLSNYSNSYLQVAGHHTILGQTIDEGRMFKEILEFAYKNRENK